MERAEEHPRSSAQCHLTGRDRLQLVDMEFWAGAGGAESWEALLASSEEQWEMRRLERTTYVGKPLGTREFCDHVGSLIATRMGRRVQNGARLAILPKPTLANFSNLAEIFGQKTGKSTLGHSPLPIISSNDIQAAD